MNDIDRAIIASRLTDLHISAGTLVGDRSDVLAFITAVVNEADLTPWADITNSGLVAATIRMDVERADRGEDPFAIWDSILSNMHHDEGGG